MHWIRKAGLALGLCFAALHASQAAKGPPETAVWHCSKQQVPADDQGSDANFLAPQEGANGVIEVTLQDLLAVYSGYPLRVAGKPLFACFMPGKHALSLDALSSLGLNAAAMQMLARKSAIVQRQLRFVMDEREMQVCLERNFPSFGYLSEPVHTDKVAPCF